MRIRGLMAFALLAMAMLTYEADARPKYGMAGCGLGSLVIGPGGGQISAATTNGTFSSQGFGITSGTSNCLEPRQMAAVKAQKDFFASNYGTLSKQMAQGDGQTLKAFSATLGCNDQAFSRFAGVMKQSHEQIFSAPGAVASLRVVTKTAKKDQVLSQQCTQLI